ncbi:IS1 family transposase [Psychroserpens damuponensis]|uniref:IS1 family transposase n=1 Tax=Psychroserpens damuponensis TaxID=943936 RepID=UPI0005906DEE|nr:IS1 family transposase [Psychroserpens damuponensis]
MKCNCCKSLCIKNGFQSNGKQRYYCKSCNKHQQENYRYKAYLPKTNLLIYKLVINSSGMSDIARVLEISKNTVKSRLLKLSLVIRKPIIYESLQVYEIDEMFTRINGKRKWVVYAINRKTRQIIDFAVGSRSNETILEVVNTVLLLNPKKIYTDRFSSYKSLIPKSIHRMVRFQTNLIERFNLNLRNHLKRLSRKTLCYTKNREILEATLKLYFWGNQLKFK